MTRLLQDEQIDEDDPIAIDGERQENARLGPVSQQPIVPLVASMAVKGIRDDPLFGEFECPSNVVSEAGPQACVSGSLPDVDRSARYSASAASLVLQRPIDRKYASRSAQPMRSRSSLCGHRFRSPSLNSNPPDARRIRSLPVASQGARVVMGRSFPQDDHRAIT
jgi:hypothetical protein